MSGALFVCPDRGGGHRDCGLVILQFANNATQGDRLQRTLFACRGPRPTDLLESCITRHDPHTQDHTDASDQTGVPGSAGNLHGRRVHVLHLEILRSDAPAAPARGILQIQAREDLRVLRWLVVTETSYEARVVVSV